jgi:hypothetical protein
MPLLLVQASKLWPGGLSVYSSHNVRGRIASGLLRGRLNKD